MGAASTAPRIETKAPPPIPAELSIPKFPILFADLLRCRYRRWLSWRLFRLLQLPEELIRGLLRLLRLRRLLRWRRLLRLVWFAAWLRSHVFGSCGFRLIYYRWLVPRRALPSCRTLPRLTAAGGGRGGRLGQQHPRYNVVLFQRAKDYVVVGRAVQQSRDDLLGVSRAKSHCNPPGRRRSLNRRAGRLLHRAQYIA